MRLNPGAAKNRWIYARDPCIPLLANSQKDLPMPKLKLTERAVSALKAPHPDGRQTIYWDSELRGFGVQCSGKTNGRLYVAQRDVAGKARRISLGAVNLMTLTAAREQAARLLLEMQAGKD